MSEDSKHAVQSAWNGYRFAAERVAEAIERGNVTLAAQWERRADKLLRAANQAFSELF